MSLGKSAFYMNIKYRGPIIQNDNGQVIFTAHALLQVAKLKGFGERRRKRNHPYAMSLVLVYMTYSVFDIAVAVVVVILKKLFYKKYF
jgi:hypothetical protein